MSNTIINVFDNETDLRKVYPKKFHFSLQDIFNDYWDDFVLFAKDKNLNIRPVVFDEVNKMRICKTPEMGFSVYECPDCHKTMNVYNTCKGRFCNSCGVKYAKQRTTEIMNKLLDTKHRHLVFTIPDILWSLFQKDRSLLSLMFEAVSRTLLSWFHDSYKDENFKPGFILVLHTFGRDNKWNVHIHCLLVEAALGNTKSKKVDFFPYEMLRKRFRTCLLNLLSNKLGNSFKELKNKCYKDYENGFYVRAKKSEFKSSKKNIEYILRYCGRPCFAAYRIIDIRNDYITFWYQRHEDDKIVVERIHIFEFISRLIKHIPERNFKTIRYYGFYSSKKHKLLDTCRMLIHSTKKAFYKSKNLWRNLIFWSFSRDPLQCSCGSTLVFSYRVPRFRTE